VAEVSLVGLQSLADAFSDCTHQAVSPIEVAYLVRQIHIGHGCINGCSHCFANPPPTLEQMTISSFNRLALEFAQATRQRGEVFPFLFLGASSDPAMIVDFAVYARTWIGALPDWHPVRFYTHGWMLASDSQQRECDAFLKVLASFPCRIGRLALSVDVFSKLARNNWSDYVSNAARNLRSFAEVVPRQSLKLEVTYPPSRLTVAKAYTIDYWRALAAGSPHFPKDEAIEHLLSQATTEGERECGRLTSAVFIIGERAGLDRRQTALISRDAGAAFPSGRASSFYASRPREEAEKALAGQREHGLYALRSFPSGNRGIVLMPDGTARLVDYLGYKLGPWLKSGCPVIPYAESFARVDHPWGLLRCNAQTEQSSS